MQYISYDMMEYTRKLIRILSVILLDCVSYDTYPTICNTYLRHAMSYDILTWLLNGFQSHSNESFELTTGTNFKQI